MNAAVMLRANTLMLIPIGTLIKPVAVRRIIPIPVRITAISKAQKPIIAIVIRTSPARKKPSLSATGRARLVVMYWTRKISLRSFVMYPLNSKVVSEVLATPRVMEPLGVEVQELLTKVFPLKPSL